MTNNPANPELTMDLRDLLAPAVVRNGALASTLIFGAGVVTGQETYRSSLTGDAALERHALDIESLPYTMKSGDFSLLLAPELSVSYNSNITIASDNPQADYLLRPGVHVIGSYTIGKRNLLSLNANIGYNQYLEHPQYSTLSVVSGSQVSFDLYAGDFGINLHDRFAYTRDPGSIAALANTAVYGGLYNTIGFSVTRDFLDFVPTIGYDHYNFVASDSQFGYQNNGSELLSGRAGFRLHPNFITGFEATGSFTHYNSAVLNDSTGWSTGAYGEWRPGDYLQLLARAGYSAYLIDQTSLTIKAVDENAWYLDLTVTHDITDAITYSLSGGHELVLGVSTDTIEDWYCRAKVDWKILKNLTITTGFSYENGTQGYETIQGAINQEDFNWFAGNASLTCSITKRLEAKVDYRYTIRSSNLPLRDYTQNLVGLRLIYAIK
jgi:hypothetical protein